MRFPTQRTMLPLMSLCALIAALVAPFFNRPASAATGREPVIVIPGVAGSELSASYGFTLTVPNGHGGTYTHTYGAGEKVWVNTWEAALSGDDDYFDALKMQADGVTPVAPALRPTDIYHSAYDDLINYLRGQGYVDGVDLWIFPYDWRRDLRTTSSQLNSLITRALTATNGGRTDQSTWTIRRADIVAHSMGGLVSRYYISDPARAARVDQLITLGSPQLGSVKFLKTLMYGDQFGPSFLGIGFNPDEIKDVVQNMPGAMQLLPSRGYYTYYDNSDSVRLRPYKEDRDVDGNGVVGGVLSYSGVKQLLLNTGKNGTVMNIAEVTHDGMDGIKHGGVNGVRWAALVGQGSSTLGQLREYTGSCLTWTGYKPCPKREELVVDGDGTVSTMSAAMGDPWRNTLINSGAQLWYINREHGALVERDYVLGVAVNDGPVLPWIGDLLRGTIPMSTSATSTTLSVTSTTDTATRPSVVQGPQLSGTSISALGPVALQVSDAEGRTTGRKAGEVDAAAPAIPGTSYQRLPEGEFAFTKQDRAYTLNMVAEREGSTDLKVRVLGNGRVERTAVYLGVLLGANGRAQLALQPGAGSAAAPQAWPTLQIDADGDGTFERSVQASAVLDARQSDDTNGPELKVATPTAQAGRVTIRWQAADQGAGMLLEQATLDAGTANARQVTNGETLALAPGQHRLLVVAQDRAGNADSREVVFNVR
jgi:pimeloyl-ACP methyl ester carboxylesterase